MSKHGKGKGKGPSVDIGTRGDDLLVGGPGKDLLLGLRGNDVLDGGGGNDRVRGDSGNDRAIYTMAENLGARDEYDGGKGFDTLELRLTYGEYLLASVQRDLARFEAFLSQDDHHHHGHGRHHHHHHHGHGREFEFQSFNLDVKGFEALAVVLVNTGPTAGADSAAIDEDHVLAGGGLLANDTDPDHLDVLKVVDADATSALGALVTVNADGTYSYDATGVLALQALQVGESATDTFEYTIADLAGAQSSAIVTITVSGVNDAPEAADDAFTLTEDELLSASLLANDSDVEDDPLTVASAVPGVGADGSLQFDPRALAEYQALQEGESLQVSFSYTVDDGHGGSNSANVAITVTGVNDAPDAADDAYTMDEDSTLTITVPGVLANDDDIEDDALSAILASGPAHGTLTLNADGSFSYTPDADFFGADSFTYKANDGRADSDMATVSITVNDVAEKPTKVVDSLDPGAPLDYYIRFEGAGEDDWLHLGSFSLSFASSATVGEGGGGAGKVSAQDMFAALGSSDAIPQLLQTLATGKHVMEAEIEAYQAGGKLQLVDQYYFEDVLLKQLQLSGADGIPGAESLSFEFERFNHSHAQLKADGTVGPAVESGWDFQQGKAFTGGPAHAGDALKAKVEDDTGGSLDYFVHFDGVDGWLRLQSMGVGFQQSGSLGGGGGGAGKASHTGAHMVLGLSEELLELSDALLEGRHFQSAQIEVYQAGGKQQLVNEYTFEDVLLTGLQTANATTHQISFDFARYGHAHIGQKADGTQDTPVLGGYDFKLGKAFTPDAPSAEGLKDEVPSINPGAPLDYYIRFEGAGEDDWLHLGSFSLGFTSSGTAGGGGAGVVSAQDLFSALGSSDAIPQLLQTLATGKHVVEAEIEAYQQGEKQQLVDQYYFQDVLLTSLEVSGADGIPGVQSLSFEFDRFNHSHAQLKADGTVGPAVESGWDFQQGKAFTGGPAHAGDALKAKVEDDTGGTLDYFVHFDGVDGWLRLQSMSVGFQQSGSLGGGGGAGKATHTDAHLVLGLSEALLELSDALLGGQHLNGAQIEAYRSGSKNQLVEEYTFEDVLLTGLQTGNATTNLLSFDFARYGHAHVGQKADGSADTPVLGGYDFVQAKAFTPDAPVAQATGKAPVESIDPGTALDYYIRFEGAGADDWLNLGSFSLGFASSGTVDGGGSGAGVVSAQDVFSILGSSDAIPKLLQTLAAGKHVVEAEIEAYQQGGKQHLVDQYYFQDVLLKSLQLSGADGIPGAEALSFEFGKFNHSYAQVKADGSLAPAVESGWDLQQGKAFTGGPAHAGEALKAKVEEDTGGTLEYFVRFDGVDGWLQLHSMSLGFQQSGSLGSGGGGGAGKASHSDVFLLLGSSKELLDLSDALFNGQHLKDAEIEVYRLGGDKRQQVEEYTFEDVLLTSLQTTNATINQVSFDFARYGHAHIGQKADGSADVPVLGGYDFVQGKAWTPDAPHADVDLF